MNKLIFAGFLAVLLCAIMPSFVFAQTGVSLETEIKNLETAAAKNDVSPAQRHSFLVRLARLRQLTGDIEGAARNWFEAAGAIPGRVDDDALLSCAYCLAAMGEWDRAATALMPLLEKSARARFLNTSVKAFKSGDLSELAALADKPEYLQIKPEIIFVLWKLSEGAQAVSKTADASPFKLGGGSQMWRQRLITEFPQSPEGRLAFETSSITVRPSPFWFFAGGLDSLPLAANPAPGNIAQPVIAPPPLRTTAQTAPVSQPAVAAQPTAQTTVAAQPNPAAQQSQTTARLQTGIFGRQLNAQAQADNLLKAGFTPSIEQRTVNGSPMWAVTVFAGTDQTQTANALRAAGFESFLIK